jgi:hypothetical protein
LIIGTPHIRGAGYLINGVNLTRPYEADILTCAHCQKILQLHLWKEEGGFCRREMKPLCLHCADRALTFGCEPFMKILEAFAKEQTRLMQFHKVAAAMPPIYSGE